MNKAFHRRLMTLENSRPVHDRLLRWPDVRPMMLAVGADPVGDEILSELAQRQMEGRSCTAVMRRLTQFLKSWKCP